ncbi:OmpA family protein [Parathalassolituus penaei]|uniref:OmpA family protein n=1 Tax=Parathalassolituus penaei TaxID=2997323 RepID=A0A9X3IQG0_9GAMM|nr:OmpA family protein [Parathalassolituus penaei]MCY0964132.1 OmpA family protein [Parathalassolituus penaei]
MKKMFSTATLSATLAAVLVTSGCTTFDAYTGEEKTSNTAIGAGIGAGVGAVIAYLDNKDEKSSKKRNQRILAAAVGGGAIGGGIGYYMDAQEAKLRKQLRGTGVSVQRDGDNINLIMPGNITFAQSRSDIASSFYDVLNSVVVVLKEYDKTLVVVAGHTDSDGSAEYNQTLSEQRARSVSDYLKSGGINAVRLETVGFGENNPIASNSTAAGKQQNRRVEITLVPAT